MMLALMLLNVAGLDSVKGIDRLEEDRMSHRSCLNVPAAAVTAGIAARDVSV
ncbi:MAG: hypothetical protein OXI95_05880 [bacterium]|nr:hypothetical protein [Rhodospirillaceae bacterium]MDE0241267.1 hypothetical protein [bacterium]MDE0416451.1 hypothetical protein [bacterium]